MSLYRSPDFGTATGEKCCLFTSAGRHFETCSDTLFWTFATTAANELFASHDVPSFSGLAIAVFLPPHFMIFLFLFGKYKHTVRLRLFPSLSVSYSGPGGAFVCQVWALWWCLDVERLTRSESPFPRLCLESVYCLAITTHCMHY